MKGNISQIADFIRSSSRNNLILSNGEIDGLSYIDMGLEISRFIEDILSDRRLSMRTQDFINTLLKNNIGHNDTVGQYVALTNIGILFEPPLKIDIEGLFNRWSQNYILFIDMGKGIVANGRLYLTGNCSQDYSVSLETINHIFYQQ